MGNISLIFNRTYFPPSFANADSTSFTIVELGKSIDLLIEGGQAPFDCQIVGGDGTGFTVEGISDGCRVTAGENATGYIQVGATDNQGNSAGTWSVGGVDCTSCTSLEWDDGVSASTIGQDDEVTVGVSGGSGCGYYDWSVEGDGFSLENSRTYSETNTLISSPSACGVANVTVTTYCGAETSAEIKCTSGSLQACTNIDNLVYRSYPGSEGLTAADRLVRPDTSENGIYRYSWGYSGSIYCNSSHGNNPSASCDDGSTMYMSDVSPRFSTHPGDRCGGPYSQSGFGGIAPGLEKWQCN